jgi:hypothetical protein
MKEDKSCEERIDKELEERVEEIKIAIESSDKNDGKVITDNDEFEDILDWVNSYSLAYDDDTHEKAKKWELSWGGPQDYFLFFEDGEIEYHFLDWYDGAKRVLWGKDKEILQELHDRVFDF